MFPFLSALSQAGNVIVDKIILTRRRVALHVFVPLLFVFLFIITALLFPALGQIAADFWTLKYLLIFLVMIISAVIWNVFFYRGIQAEKVHEFELIMMFQPLLTIFLATIILAGERNVNLEIAAFVAAIALIFAHINHNHLEISKEARGLILAVVFMSVELVLIKIILGVLSPVAVYALRTGMIALFFYLFYRPAFSKVSLKNSLLIAASGFIGVTQMVSKFYGLERYGLIYTSLILIIAPLLVYMISTIFLHEKLKIRTIICALVIVSCIIYATVLGK